MGIELELGALLASAILGQSTFARFEIETPAIRKIVKWATLSAVTLLLYRFVGHWSLLLPVFLGAAGTSAHVIWCKRNGIDPWRATPHRRYYELRGWKWPTTRPSLGMWLAHECRARRHARRSSNATSSTNVPPKVAW